MYDACCLKLCPPQSIPGLFPQKLFVSFKLMKALIGAWTFQFNWRGWSSHSELTTSMIRFPSICSAWIPDLNVRRPYSSYSPFDCIRFHMHLLTSTKSSKRKTLYGHLAQFISVLKICSTFTKKTHRKNKNTRWFVFFEEAPAAAEIASESFFQELSMPTFFESLGHKRNPLRRFGGFVRLFWNPRTFGWVLFRWWFQVYFLFSPRGPGEMINFD